MRKATQYTVIRLSAAGGSCSQQSMSREQLEAWAESADFDPEAIVFVGSPVEIRLTAQIGVKTRKPRATKTETPKKGKAKNGTAKQEFAPPSATDLD